MSAAPWSFAGGFARPFACLFATAPDVCGTAPHRERDRGALDFPTSPRHLEVIS
jgi:hypothetical protein